MATQEQIERSRERAIDALDRRFLSTSMPQAEYDRLIAELDGTFDRAAADAAKQEQAA